MEMPPGITMRTAIRPGDIGRIVRFHGELYAREYGFDSRFEAYVAGPLADVVLAPSPRNRVWIAERDGHLAGCVAIVAASDEQAQIRWFLVDPAFRGAGLGRKLLAEAIAFSREAGYRSIFLWTVDLLAAAAHLYTEAGFRKTEEKPGCPWGVDLVEERYDLALVS